MLGDDPQHGFPLAVPPLLREQSFDEVLPQLSRSRPTALGVTEGFEKSSAIDDRVVGISDAVEQHGGELTLVPRTLSFGTIPDLLNERPDSGDDRGGYGNVGPWALLNVHQSDFERHSLEARDTTACIDPLMMQYPFGVEWRQIGVDGPKKPVFVVRARGNRLGDNVADDGRYPIRVFPVDL